MGETSRLGRAWKGFPRRSVDRRASTGAHDFRLLFERAPTALVVVLPDAPTFTVVAASDAYLHTTLTVRDGPNGIIGHGLFEVFPDVGAIPSSDGRPEPAGVPSLHASLARCIATGAPDALPVQRYEIRRPDGTRQECFWNLLNCPVLGDASGRVTHIIHRIEDVTLTEQSVRRAIEAEHATALAEEANAVKTRFLAAMSHELRTPLTAIAGYVDLLTLGVHGELTDAQRDALDRIRRAEQHLLGLINEVLSYAKLEAGQVQLLRAPVPLERVLRDVASFLAPLAQKKEIELAFDFGAAESGTSLTTVGDEEKIRQVVINLVSNAIKFTACGGRVRVSCASERGSRQDRIVVRIEDTGTGIADGDLERIFEPFVQVGKKLSASGGTGLGLPISRELARAMGGDVTVTSRLGAGSTFQLLLPRWSKAGSRAA